MGRAFLMRADDLWDGEMRPVTLNGQSILLVRVGANIRAYENRCVHQGVALSHGTLEAGVITCCAHHWQFDAMTGRGINPAIACLKRLSLFIDDDAIYLQIAGEDAHAES